MLRQVRGLGNVHAQPGISAPDSGRDRSDGGSHPPVARLAGESDTILLEMSNPQIEQAAARRGIAMKAAEAEYQSLRVKLESDLMTQKGGSRDRHRGSSQAKSAGRYR